MDNQKQIEEMAKVMSRHYEKGGICGLKDFAEALYNAGYRKIPEGAVVLTEEEYKKLKHGSGTLERLYNQYPFSVLVGFNSMVFSQDRECFERLYDEIEKRASKETAEKFAEMVSKAFMGLQCIDIDEWNWCQRKIDEICEEIVEGKV